MASNVLTFDPSTYLYYSPELGAQGISTLERAQVYYVGSNDAGGFFALLQTVASGSNASIATQCNYLPTTAFDARLFLLQNTRLIDLYSITSNVSAGMARSGYSATEIARLGTYLDVYRVTVDGPLAGTVAYDEVRREETGRFRYDFVYQEAVGSNVFGVDANVSMSRDNVLNVPTRVIAIDRSNQTFDVAITGTSRLLSSSRAGVNQWRLQGLLVPDVDRVGRIAFVRSVHRRLTANAPVVDPLAPVDQQLVTNAWDPAFNVELYRMLYPDARTLSREQCYTDFLGSLTNGEARIGYAADIVAVSGRASVIAFPRPVIMNKDLIVRGNASFKGNEVVIDNDLVLKKRALMPNGGLIESTGPLIIGAPVFALSNAPGSNVEILLHRSHPADRARLLLVGADASNAGMLSGACNGSLTIAVASNASVMIGTQGIDSNVPGAATLAVGSNMVRAWPEVEILGRDGTAVPRLRLRHASQLGGSGAHLSVVGTDPASVALAGASNGSVVWAMSPSNAMLFGEEGRPYTMAVGHGAVIVQGRVEADEMYTVSDRRLKRCVQRIPPACALDTVLQLQGYRFRARRAPDRGVQLGLLAQEVRAIAPELVKRDARGYLSVAYGNMAGLFVEALRAIDGRLSAIDGRLQALEGNNHA